MGYWSKPTRTEYRQTTLTNKTSWAGTSAEQWGTEEAVCAQADCPSPVDVYAELMGNTDSDSSGNNVSIWVQISLDGGSTWTDGTATQNRATAAPTDDRDSLYAFCMIAAGVVTGDIQARAMGQVATNTTGRSLNNGSIALVVKTAE